MGSSVMSGLAICCCVSALSAGCDPVRTTVQPVLLRVTASDVDSLVKNADVALKFDYDRNIPPTEQLPETQRPTYPWFSATTGEDGRAEILVKWTMLDRSLGSNPPAWRDQLTGKSYLVRVSKNQTHEVERLTMNTGASVRGDVFAVQVIEIQKPRYIQAE